MQLRAFLLQKRVLFIIGTLMVFAVISLILATSTPRNTSQEILPSPTPAQVTSSPEQDATDEVPLYMKPNPTYDAKIREQPFWTMLPRWTDHYKIEYRDSADVILIHLFLPNNATNVEKNTLQGQYRAEALTWLRENGARIERLNIKYRIYE